MIIQLDRTFEFRNEILFQFDLGFGTRSIGNISIFSGWHTELIRNIYAPPSHRFSKEECVFFDNLGRGLVPKWNYMCMRDK